MKPLRRCPVCDTPLPPHSPEGFCPGCSFLGAITLGDEPQSVNEAEPAQTSSDQELGDYELQEEIGRGGMGIVFKAHQISLNRTVAVKMLLHGRFADPAFRRRFRLEAEAAAHLEHPNIVSIHEIGQHAGQPFFSMVWIDGRSLDRELAGGPVPADRSAHIIATLAHAVHHAHQHGILHRDLKPHNVIIDAEGEPHLTDFGLAKLLEDDTGITMSETILGSPGYVAPEQAEGKNAEVTTAADIFSLGAMLYTMLTGAPPFSGESPIATLHKVIECEPPRPRSIVKTLPRDLETICLKCLQKEPSRRYRSAEALAVDLERLEKNEPILARPVSDLERIGLWCRRRPWRAGLIAALTVSILAGAFGAVSQWRRAEVASRLAEAAALNAEREAYSAKISLAQSLVQQGQFDRARAGLFDAGPEALRGWEWGWLQRECNQDLMTLGAEGVRHSDCAFSPDGRFIVTGSEDGAVRICDLRSDSPPRVLRGGDESEVHFLTLSPDGRTAITTHQKAPAKVWDLEKKALAYTLDEAASWITRATYSSDGKSAATGAFDGSVRLWNRESGEPIREVAQYEDGAVLALAFSPDDRQLAYIGGTRDPADQNPTHLCILDLESRALRKFAGHTASVLALAFSPDGEHLATAGRDATVRIKSARGDDPLRIIHSLPQGSNYSALAFSPDSRKLMVAAGEADAGSLFTIDIGREIQTRRQKGFAQYIQTVSYSPDGQIVATAAKDGTVRLWPIQPAPGFLNLEGHDQDVWAVAVSPDGQYAATGSLDQTAKIWEMQTGRLVHTIQVHFPVVSVAFTGDSRHLVTNAPGNTAKVWPVDGRGEVLELRGHEGVVFAVAADPKGRWIATGSRDKTARLWDASNGGQLRMFSGSVLMVTSVDFSPDGGRLAAGGMQGHATVWESQTGRQLFEMRGHQRAVTSIHFSSDGSRLATGAVDGFARIWDANTGNPVARPLKSRTHGIQSIAFSPDGARLVTTGTSGVAGRAREPNKTVALWDVASGQRLWEFTPHNAGTYAVAFSPEGTRLVTGGGDNTARIWTVFPWKMADHPETAEATEASRLESFKRRFWSQTVAHVPSEDRRIEIRTWSEKNLPKTSRIKTSPALPIPPRSSEAVDGQIDLSRIYNGALNEVWQPVTTFWYIDADLAAFPPGQHVFGGISFDVRGVIQLGIDNTKWTHFPRTVEIPVDRNFQRFHVIHSTAFRLPRGGDGAVVGAYRMHFEDGDEVLHEIVYGDHLRKFWAQGDPRPECAKGDLIWKWKEATFWNETKHRRLFMATFNNPRPETKVTHIEFLSGDTRAAPFLVGMTVE